MNSYTIEKVKEAYLKLKSSIYFDSTNLLLKKQIVEFEDENIEIKLQELSDNLEFLDFIEEEEVSINDYFNNLLSELSYIKLPKSIEESNKQEEQFIKNFETSEETIIKKIIYHVEAPIELHIASVLWIMEEGHKLVKNIDNSYGYVLEETEAQNIVSGLRLFKPYYTEYQKWRDNSINSAKDVLEKQDVAIISLDIKNFYHSTDLKFNKIRKEIGSSGLTNLLEIIHRKYSTLLKNQDTTITNNIILPIGFLSSGILANWYLKQFDDKIKEVLNPVYYGRYVDDILITIPISNIQKFDTKKNLLTELFVENKILNLENILEEDLLYRLDGYENLLIQNEKIVVMLFDKNQPSSLLDKFKSEIRKNSSEYRFLPDEISIHNDFEKASSNVIYDGSKNKLRSIKEWGDDKFGISSYLSKLIFLLLQDNEKLSNDISKQILNFFQEKRTIKYYTLWEKVLILFIIGKDIKSLKYFYNNTTYTIDSIEGDRGITHSLKEYLDISLSMAIGYKDSNLSILDSKSDIYSQVILYKKTYLLRKQYLTNIIYKDDYQYYPRYIHFHEILLDKYKKVIDNGEIEEIVNIDIANEANDLFQNINIVNEDTLVNMNLPKWNKQRGSDKYPIVELQNDICKNELKIGLANITIKDSIFTHEYIRGSQPDPNKKIALNKILNQAIEEEIDLLVLPECSIPYNWLDWLVSIAYSKKIGMVFGLEHVVAKDKAYNLMVTLLPVKVKKYNSLYIDIRVKKHYSPGEEDLLKKYRYKIPKTSIGQSLFNWNNINFTVFNCFELSNISDREKFKSKVDFIVASEFNRDIDYFSNLVESTARDLHCYFIQSNNAKYGDNRIYSPAQEKYKRDIVKIKGGENSTLLVGTINIKQLREFQIKRYDKSDKNFKPLPPAFDYLEVKKRIKKCEDIKRV